MNCGSVGCCLAMCRDCSRRKPPPPQPGCRRTPLEPPSRAELQALGLGSVCVPPPPPPVWCTHGEGGAVHLLLAAGGGWESEAPLPAWDLCSGGECVWENGSSVCKSQGKKKNPQKPKQFPLDLCPLLGLAAAPDLGVQSSGMLVLPSLAPAAAGAWPEPAWALACSGTPLLKPVWSKLFTFLGWGWHLRRQSGTWGALG